MHTLQVDATQIFSLGGELTLDTIDLMPDSSAPAKILMIGDASFQPLDGASARIVNGAGVGNSGLVDLGGVNRTWLVEDGAATVDLSVDLPIIHGALTKSGAGSLALRGMNFYAGDTTVLEGILSMERPFLSNTADVYLSDSAILDLQFSGNPDVIDSLFFDGVSQAAGIWGAPGSGAPLTTSRITGTGLLQVSTYVAPIPGDFDSNGVVDGVDLTQWRGDFGQNGGSDADEDGDSDGTDFLTWQRNLSGTASVASSAEAVPEPAACLLALLGALLGLLVPHSHLALQPTRVRNLR